MYQFASAWAKGSSVPVETSSDLSLWFAMYVFIPNMFCVLIFTWWQSTNRLYMLSSAIRSMKVVVGTGEDKKDGRRKHLVWIYFICLFVCCFAAINTLVVLPVHKRRTKTRLISKNYTSKIMAWDYISNMTKTYLSIFLFTVMDKKGSSRFKGLLLSVTPFLEEFIFVPNFDILTLEISK